MIIKQLSVFLENATGHFLGISTCLGKAGVNISALSLAETAEYGIARMIVDDEKKGAEALREAGYNVNLADVIGMNIPDAPGALSEVLAKLAAGGVNVSYIYGYSSEGSANLVLKVGDPEEACKLLK
ncbi:MAG: amino acid-binding protein [Clostridiales Family XIII bacterium]|jgi:hypothetical protein|nr:amino acid-binding protein [Clostridiales Family XIII bacterium]